MCPPKDSVTAFGRGLENYANISNSECRMLVVSWKVAFQMEGKYLKIEKMRNSDNSR
jgi:hypothetical protein